MVEMRVRALPAGPSWSGRGGPLGIYVVWGAVPLRESFRVMCQVGGWEPLPGPYLAGRYFRMGGPCGGSIQDHAPRGVSRVFFGSSAVVLSVPLPDRGLSRIASGLCYRLRFRCSLARFMSPVCLANFLCGGGNRGCAVVPGLVGVGSSGPGVRGEVPEPRVL